MAGTEVVAVIEAWPRVRGPVERHGRKGLSHQNLLCAQYGHCRGRVDTLKDKAPEAPTGRVGWDSCRSNFVGDAETRHSDQGQVRPEAARSL